MKQYYRANKFSAANSNLFFNSATNLPPRFFQTLCFLLRGMSVYKTTRLFNNLCELKLLSCNLQLSKKLCQSQPAMEDRPVEKSIQEKLTSGLNPLHLKIVNESYMHNVPKGSETHFKVYVVSQEFENLALIKRHRLVNSLLEEELKSGVHALSIVAKAPSQWNPSEEIEPSPKCRGGFGK